MVMAGGETTPTNTSPGVDDMNWILLNIPLGAAMVAFTVGLPLWVMLKHPEGQTAATAQTAAARPNERTGPAGRNIYELAAQRYANEAV